VARPALPEQSKARIREELRRLKLPYISDEKLRRITERLARRQYSAPALFADEAAGKIAEVMGKRAIVDLGGAHPSDPEGFATVRSLESELMGHGISSTINPAQLGVRGKKIIVRPLGHDQVMLEIGEMKFIISEREYDELFKNFRRVNFPR